jgi:hypothetical protein
MKGAKLMIGCEGFKSKMKSTHIFASFIIIAALFILGSCKKNESFVPIHSFHEVNFDAIPTTGTLVLFDVDETLIQPVDTYVLNEQSPEAVALLRSLAEQYYAQGHTKDDADYLASIMLKEAQRPLIEPFIIDEIRRLQLRGIPVIACTAMNTGKFGIIERMEEWRYEHLKSLGFEGSYADKSMPLEVHINHPVFYHGILATDFGPKGPAIGAFLDALDLHPSTIIMFDDNVDFLISVKDECAKRNIAFKGYHYCGAKEKAWDEPLIRFQIDYLINHQYWLDDDTARAMMREQPLAQAFAQ